MAAVRVMDVAGAVVGIEGHHMAKDIGMPVVVTLALRMNVPMAVAGRMAMAMFVAGRMAVVMHVRMAVVVDVRVIGGVRQ